MIYLVNHLIGYGKMSMVGQSESDDIFISELKANSLTVTGSPVLLSLFQCENKNVDLITLGLLIFSIQIQISSDLLCPIILILPHPALPHLSMKEFSPEEPKCLKQVVVIVQVLGWLVPVSVRKPNLYVK